MVSANSTRRLTLRRRPLNGASLARVLWRYPFMTAQVVGAIHWQALRLWLKRNPVHDHPARLRIASAHRRSYERDRQYGRNATRPKLGAFDRFLRQQLLEPAHVIAAWTAAAGGGRRAARIRPTAASHADLQIRMEILDPAFYRAVVANGSVGAGEAYVDGLWRCDDLVGLAQLLVRNRDVLDGMETRNSPTRRHGDARLACAAPQ